MRNGQTPARWLVLVLLVASNAAGGYTGGDHEPYVQDVTGVSAVIVWQTESPGDSTVEYGITSTYGSSAHDAALVNNHQVLLAGLEPATTYHYRVALRDAVDTVSWTRDATFRTAPTASVPFSFAVMADSHKSGTDLVLPQVVASILSLPYRPDLILHAGDLTDDGSDADWNWYFFGTALNPMMGPLTRGVALYPSRGNHEKDATYYFYFAMPAGGGYGGEQWYSYDYSSAHFVHLDSNAALTSGSPQALWLERDLASATAEWIFVTLHHPVVTMNFLHGLFKRYGVDVVFSGHDHFYDRALREGVHYITAATAGGDPWNARSTRWSQFTLSTSGFVTANVTRATATLTGRYPNGDEFDSVTLTHVVDSVAPAPDPMTWAVVPYAAGTSSIAMRATTATDSSGVEYFFGSTTAGGHDSGWLSGTSYTDTGLSPGTRYCYRVQARDRSASLNTTGWSTTLCADTLTKRKPR